MEAIKVRKKKKSNIPGSKFLSKCKNWKINKNERISEEDDRKVAKTSNDSIKEPNVNVSRRVLMIEHMYIIFTMS